ncbi:MerR family transcriptional regulator [Streptomyces globisporus]|uniref:MerR family transcriptional regulator n=1 Tax=Streptomyces globisporus TaxID=1908 RepID=UPI00099BA508|nr:MerR family transcriptional regulator [Streptomyces globisporus]
MKIGELARETGVSVRLLRYYEEQGLLDAERTSGGQRVYGSDAPAVVRRVRTLLGAGLPTRIIAEVLDCVCGSEAEIEPCLSPLLVARLDAIDERIHDLQGARSSLAALVAVTEGRGPAAADQAGTAAPPPPTERGGNPMAFRPGRGRS